MRQTANALTRRHPSFGTALRFFGLFLLMTFVVEATVMAALPRFLPSTLPPMVGGFLDASILTLVLGPFAWRIFLVPLRRLHDDRGKLLERILSAQETERIRIARDLHDGLGQNLTSMLLHLRVIREMPKAEDAREHIATLQRITANSLDDLRRLVRDTRPPVLDDLGLAAAVGKQLDDVQAFGHIATTLTCDIEGPARLPPAVETALYRVIQEAVTNAVRHAHAARVTVKLSWSDCEALATITDDGRGFDVAEVLGCEQVPFGLLSMQERMRLLRGSVTFESVAGRRTVVRARVPLVSTPGES